MAGKTVASAVSNYGASVKPKLASAAISGAAKHRLIVGKGYIENVTPEMWAYEVSGKQVLWHWFQLSPPRPQQAGHWRSPPAVAARKNPAGSLAAGIHE